MQKTFLSLPGLIAAYLLVAVATVGCAKSDAGPDAAGAAATEESATADESAHVHDHSGWWCAEHGVPEEVCGRCNAKLAAEFQRKGDWCQEHDRPDSQCFVCHPELEARFAAQYEAKLGEKPPKPEG